MSITLKQAKRLALSVKDVSQELYGFGGHCGAAALALNEVLFSNTAQIRAVFNETLANHGIYIGHIYVYLPELELCLDADGVLKPEDEMHEYAMLDSQDEEYQLYMAEFTGRDDNPEAYEEVAYFELAPTDPILQKFPMNYLDHNKAILEKTL